MSETSDTTTPLIKAIRALPFCVAYRLHSGQASVRGGRMHFEEKGTPDVLALLGASNRMARAVFFETKSPDGTVKPHQEKVHAELRRLGFRVEVPRSFAEAMRVVREVVEG